MSIAAKLLVWFLIVGIVPIAIFDALSHFQFRDTILEEELTKLGSILDHRVEQIEHYVGDRKRETEALGRNPAVLRHMVEFDAAFEDVGAQSDRYRQVERSFRPFAEWFLQRFELYDLFLIDLDGNIVYTARREVDFATNLRTGAFRETGLANAFRATLETGETQLSAFGFYRPSNEPAAFVAAPLVDNGTTTAIIAVQIDTQQIDHLAGNYTGLGKTGEILLAQREGNVATVIAPLRHAPDAAFTRRFPLDAGEAPLPIQKAVLGMRDVGRAMDYRGVDILAAWTHIPTTGWGVVVKIDAAEAFAPALTLRNKLILLAVAMIALVSVAALIVARSFSRPIRSLTSATRKMARGDFKSRAPVYGRSEFGHLAESFNQMAEWLQANAATTARNTWLEKGLSRLDEAVRGQTDVKELCRQVISTICRHLDLPLGAIYVAEDTDGEETDSGGWMLHLCGSYAHSAAMDLPEKIGPGEGLAGQAAREERQILLKQVPDDYFRISSSLGEGKPRAICVTPVLHQDRLVGVVETASLEPLSELELEFLKRTGPVLAVAINSTRAGSRLAQSLERSQMLTTELQAQQEELKASNEELSEQTRRLRVSESALRNQQDELKAINEELEEKNRLLQAQKAEVESARHNLEEQTRELALANQYKSEFLANMSHELRTPLNSLLLLAQGLGGNKEGNLTEKQRESVEIIYQSGRDLLQLINEILDLSKIEAGHMELLSKEGRLEDLADRLRRAFEPVARDKGLEYTVQIEPGAPEKLTTDHLRLEQVLRNLVGNSLKFTDSGHVRLDFGRAGEEARFRRIDLPPDQCLAITVEDTGIGIPEEAHKRIFQAFRQVDSGVSRKYGGTGLGLSIAERLTRLLGGEIQLESTPGEGSTFTVYLPLQPAASPDTSADDARAQDPLPPDDEAGDAGEELRQMAPLFDDDRNAIAGGDSVILIIEDDERWARTLGQKCREHGFKCLHAPSGEAGIALAQTYQPRAIVLDIGLPGIDGWEVLARLKKNAKTHDIPVHVISADEQDMKARITGAVGHAVKPLEPTELDRIISGLKDLSAQPPGRVLVIEDEDVLRGEIVQLLRTEGAEVVEAKDGASGLERLREQAFSCVVLDLKLPDLCGTELLSTMKREHLDTPVIVHTAREITAEEEEELAEHAEAIVIKDAHSAERLLDEVSLFLNRVVAGLSESRRKLIRDMHDGEDPLHGKVVLVADDDMRTTFAMASLLGEHGVVTVKAGTGKAALEQLEQRHDIDLVLMDIMMPEMDGLEAIRNIRSQHRLKDLPIIAITAKAMEADRQNCLEAGASDYLSKPVDSGRLLSILRVWLQR